LARGDEIITERSFSHPHGEPMACFIVSKASENDLLSDDVITDHILAIEEAIDGSAQVAFLIFPSARSTNFGDIVNKIGLKLQQSFPSANWDHIGQMMYFGLDPSFSNPEVIGRRSRHPAIILKLNTATIVATRGQTTCRAVPGERH